MKKYSTVFYNSLRELSAEATRVMRYYLGNEWSVTARSNGFSFSLSIPSRHVDLVFFVRIDDNRVPILELPALNLNVPAGGLDNNYHFLYAAFHLLSERDMKVDFIKLVGKLCDLIDDCNARA